MCVTILVIATISLVCTCSTKKIKCLIKLKNIKQTDSLGGSAKFPDPMKQQDNVSTEKKRKKNMEARK